jgi:hypothetical protein
LVGYADKILVSHLCVTKNGAAVFAGDKVKVFGASPEKAVMVGVGHRV